MLNIHNLCWLLTISCSPQLHRLGIINREIIHEALGFYCRYDHIFNQQSSPLTAMTPAGEHGWMSPSADLQENLVQANKCWGYCCIVTVGNATPHLENIYLKSRAATTEIRVNALFGGNITISEGIAPRSHVCHMIPPWGRRSGRTRNFNELHHGPPQAIKHSPTHRQTPCHPIAPHEYIFKRTEKSFKKGT